MNATATSVQGTTDTKLVIVVSLASTLLVCPVDTYAYAPPLQAKSVIASRTSEAAPIASIAIESLAFGEAENPVDEILRDAQARAKTFRVPSVAAQALQVIDRLKADLASLDLSELPPLEVIESEDGSGALEWFFADRRLAFTFEPEREASGWHFVSQISSGGVRAFGNSLALDLRPLISWVLAQKQV